MLAVGENTRYVGDVLAVVVAESDAVAREAVAMIDIDYEVLEPVTDMHAALQAESPSIHEGGNVLSQSITNRGDLEKSMAESAFSTHGVYETQMIEHGFMEPEACVAYPKGDGVEVLSQGKASLRTACKSPNCLDCRKRMCTSRSWPTAAPSVAKEDLSVQGHTALAAYLMGVPVKVRLTRDESIIMHPKRHPIWMEYTVGCDEDGMLTFCKGRFVGDTGAYASVGMKVLERSAGHATGAYNFPVTDIVSTAVYTNNLPCGAMRGFGVNQTAFALESCIDDLCEQGGFDRWEFATTTRLMTAI